MALPGLDGHKWNDLASCPHHRCLYVSDCEGRCVRRVCLDGGTEDRKWPVSDRPRGLSVVEGTRHILVTCVGARKVVELGPDGDLVREVSFQTDVELPWHTLAAAARSTRVRSADLLLVSHGLAASLHRVCYVDTDGRVVSSFGDGRGCDVTRLNIPCHVTIGDRCLYVADYSNRRVVELRLGDCLAFSRIVVDGLTSEPRRLHFDRVTRRLYVANGNGVSVVQL